MPRAAGIPGTVSCYDPPRRQSPGKAAHKLFPSSTAISANAVTVHGANDNDTLFTWPLEGVGRRDYDEDNDGKSPDENPVEVRHPRSKQAEQGDRSQWPWPPGTMVEQSRTAVMKPLPRLDQ